MASSIGIISMRKKKIKICSRSRSFGQREELTTRIKGILDGYPCDSGFLKELIQNADDAKASEVHIVVDFQHHPSDKVFDDSWKPLQGPALLIYNDSSFSEQDLEGIQNLGVGSKRNDPTKTGQYGIGFNVVYHLTDVPSFLTKGPNVESGQILCVLDPNCHYVPEATPSAPGVEYFDLEELWDDYSDVFNCYHSHLLLKEKGTIFRLPLRTSLFAKKSKIKKIETSEILVKNILENLINELHELLLFLNHVEKIKVSEIVEGSLKDIYWVEGIKSQKTNHDEFNHKVCEAAKILRDVRSVQQIQKSDIEYHLTVRDSKENNKTFLIVRQLGLRDSLDNTDVERAIKREELNLLPRGGVAFLIDDIAKSTILEGKPFCFLPLPDKTGLPVHFNGHFVLDHETRRNLWNDPNKSYKLIWNQLILDQIVAPCYVSGLLKLITILHLSDDTQQKDEIASKLHFFHNVFPNIDNAKNEYVKYLVKCVYKHIFKENDKLLAMWKPPGSTTELIEFVSLRGNNDVFQAVWNTLLPGDQSRFFFHKYIGKLADMYDNTDIQTLANIFKCLGIRLVDTPLFVYENMQKTGLKVKQISPAFLIMFLKSVDVLQGQSECRVDHTKYHTIQNLKLCLEYCLKCKEFKNEILGLPLCLRQDNVIQKFDDGHTIFCTSFNDLLPKSASVFLHESLVNILSNIMRGMKCFGLDDLIELLPYSLSIETYRTLNRIIEWNPTSTTLPNRHWIERLWKFIEEKNKEMNDEAKTACWTKLMPWCLLPCKKNQSVESMFMDMCIGRIGRHNTDKRYKYCLYPINFFECVLNIETFRRNFADVLQDGCQLPTLDIQNNFLQTKLPSFRKTRAVLKCLYLNRDIIQNRSSHISQVQANTILEYISEYLSERSSEDNDVIVWMTALPLHVTLTGHLVSLEGGHRILVLPDEMPTNGIGIWANQSRITLLRQNEKLNKMHLLLRCVPSGIRDTYTSFVLASFHNLPRQFHIEHLEYVRDKLLAMSFSGKMHAEQLQLIQRLADVKFVPDMHGILQQSRYFCSPFNQVMAEMCDATRFPCIEFCKKEWQKLLEWTGIKKEISVDMVIEFTKKNCRGRKI